MSTSQNWIEQSEWVRRLTLSDGRIVDIELDAALEWMQVTDPGGRVIGKIEFCEIDTPTGSCRKVTWMHLDLLDPSYKRKGIGRECLRFIAQVEGPVFAEPHDGRTRDDGSHLTGDAPGFVAQMISEGLMIELPEHCF